MKLEATPTSAVFAGVWLVLGTVLRQSLEQAFSLGTLTSDFAFLAFAIAFFFVPGYLFVFGTHDVPLMRRNAFNRTYWKAFGALAVRLVCWFLGAWGFSLIYELVLNRANAI